MRLLFRGDLTDDGDVGQAGLFGDLPQHGVAQRLARLDTTCGNLGAGSGDTELVEDEQLRFAAAVPDDIGRDTDAWGGRHPCIVLGASARKGQWPAAEE